MLAPSFELVASPKKNEVKTVAYPCIPPRASGQCTPPTGPRSRSGPAFAVRCEVRWIVSLSRSAPCLALFQVFHGRPKGTPEFLGSPNKSRLGLGSKNQAASLGDSQRAALEIPLRKVGTNSNRHQAPAISDRAAMPDPPIYQATLRDASLGPWGGLLPQASV